MSFNLIDEPWIPVIHLDGTTSEVSIAEAFSAAASIRQISADLPTQSFAILRLLLAIHHDAVGFHSEGDVAAALRDGLDVEAVSRYLTGMHDRFDLFHAERPFMQVATLHTAKNEHAPLEKLIADVPNGAPFMTTRAGEGLSRISAAEAARWLVHCQAFDPSGIRSAAVGDPQTQGGRGYPIGPAWGGQLGGIVLHGPSLAETLVYNTAPTPENPLDRPVWALDQAQTEQRSLDPRPEGPVAVLVWQSRRIRLVGDSEAVVGLVLTQGDKLTPQNRRDVEYMTAWRYSKPQTTKHGIDVYMPLKHDPSRSGWRGMPSMISDSPSRIDGKEATLRATTVESLASQADEFSELATQVGIELVGIQYGPKEATVEELYQDTLDLRLKVLDEDAADVRMMLFDAVELADKVVWESARLRGAIASASGDFDSVEGARERVRADAWTTLDQPARNWLASLSADTDTIDARREWQSLLRQVIEPFGEAVAAQASPAAITGRQTSYGFMTASKAENIFGSKLRQLLPLAYPTRERKETDDD